MDRHIDNYVLNHSISWHNYMNMAVVTLSSHRTDQYKVVMTNDQWEKPPYSLENWALIQSSAITTQTMSKTHQVWVKSFFPTSNISNFTKHSSALWYRDDHIFANKAVLSLALHICSSIACWKLQRTWKTWRHYTQQFKGFQISYRENTLTLTNTDAGPARKPSFVCSLFGYLI